MAAPQGFEYFKQGQVLIAVAGKSPTTGFDYFKQGQVLFAIMTSPSSIPHFRSRISRNTNLRT